MLRDVVYSLALEQAKEKAKLGSSILLLLFGALVNKIE